jgi:hypothetical protein
MFENQTRTGAIQAKMMPFAPLAFPLQGREGPLLVGATMCVKPSQCELRTYQNVLLRVLPVENDQQQALNMHIKKTEASETVDGRV